MAFLSLAGGAPAAPPPLGALLAGFVVLVVGLAALTLGRRRRAALRSAAGTRRALLYAVVFSLSAGVFTRVVGSALTGQEHSPWLMAVGDVLFVTLGLFVWVMGLAENHSAGELGFRGAPPVRLALVTVMGLGAVAVYALGPWQRLLAGGARPGSDELVFATLFALVGSALPEEVLFRGYLQSTLDGRAARWARVSLPAIAFAALRLLRFAPVAPTPAAYLGYAFGVVLPLGLWWGLMRDLAGGSLWPVLLSHFLLDFGLTLDAASSASN